MITDLTQQTWDAKTIELGGSILQSWIWGEFQKSLGFKVHRFSSGAYINQVTELPLILGKKYLYSAKGPLGDVQTALADMKKLSDADHSIVFSHIEPAHAIDLPRAIKDTQPTHNWLISLEDSEENILGNMRQTNRHNIVNAQKKGVVVREGNKEDILIFWKLMLETANRAKFKLHPQNYYWQIYEILGSKYLKFLLAEHEGKVLSVALVTMFGDTATYLHGGTDMAFREITAGHLLQWEAMRLAKQQGMKLYDMGGIAPDNEPNHPWAGITRFKKAFGGFAVESPGAFDQIYSPVWYNVYKNARNLRHILR